MWSRHLFAADLTGSYQWKPLKIGGGGWVVGMDYTRADGVIYCRTDQSGAYRWNPTTSTWKQLVTSASMPASYVVAGNYEGVDSITGTNTNSSVAYMTFQDQMFRSTDKGDTWDDTWATTSFASLGLVTQPNGKGRQCGERIGVDPNNNNNVYYCPINDYLSRCPAYHGAWAKVSGVPMGTANYGVTTIKFDINSGTTGGSTNVIYVTVMNNGVWKSADAGATWTNIATLSGGPGNSVGASDAAIGSDGNYYVCCGLSASATSGVWKFVPSTGVWTNISPSTNTIDYQAIAVDPTNASRMTVMKSGGTSWTSINGGTNWTTQTWERISTNVAWLGSQSDHWLSVGQLRYDPNVSGQLWFAEGFGMWNTTDIADTKISWVERSSGIEETVGNVIIAPPGGKPVSASWDIGTFYHSNPDLYNATRGLSSFIACWDVDWCASTPNFIAGVFQDNTASHPPYNRTGFSTDGGQSWTKFPYVVAGDTTPNLSNTTLAAGTIAVSATDTNNIVWCPAGQGNPNVSPLPYYTTDRGTTWAQSSFGGPTNLAVPAYNVNFHPLAADRVTAGTFYFYAPQDGIYKSANGGANWARVGNNPRSKMYNASLKATPGHAGDLWFSEGYQARYPANGIWHSTDGGGSWSSVSGITRAYSFGFGAPKPGGSGYPTVYVAGQVAGVDGVYRSVDSGASWDKICSYPLGIFEQIVGVDGDKTTYGKVYVAFPGAGFAYGVTTGP